MSIYQSPQKKFFSNMATDFGFGTKYVGKGKNLINEDGSFNIEKKGSYTKSVYEHLVNSNWKRFFIDIILIYFIINSLFTFMYMAAGIEHLHNVHSQNFLHDFTRVFFFSIHTFTTVGYGNIYPTNTATSIIAAFDALVGLLTLALMTGLFFARFSKAPANISFSKNAILTKLNDKDTLQFRIVNNSDATLINVEASVTMTWLESTSAGYRRRFYRLGLELSTIYLFPLNWTIVHEIDDNSPLKNMTKEQMEEDQVEFLIMIKAYNDTYNQTVFKNHSYHFKDILKDVRFVSMYETTEEKTVLHLDRLDDFEKI